MPGPPEDPCDACPWARPCRATPTTRPAPCKEEPPGEGEVAVVMPLYDDGEED